MTPSKSTPAFPAAPLAAPVVLTLEQAAHAAGGINPQPLPPCRHLD